MAFLEPTTTAWFLVMITEIWCLDWGLTPMSPDPWPSPCSRTLGPYLLPLSLAGWMTTGTRCLGWGLTIIPVTLTFTPATTTSVLLDPVPDPFPSRWQGGRLRRQGVLAVPGDGGQ